MVVTGNHFLSDAAGGAAAALLAWLIALVLERLHTTSRGVVRARMDRLSATAPQRSSGDVRGMTGERNQVTQAQADA